MGVFNMYDGYYREVRGGVPSLALYGSYAEFEMIWDPRMGDRRVWTVHSLNSGSYESNDHSSEI
jgi:hypothetical protein